MRTANNRAGSLVTERKIFKGANLFSEQVGPLYVVFSYGHHWPLYVHNSRTGRWYGNGERYSVTTSKHKSQARPNVAGIVEKSCEELRAMIDAAELVKA